VSAQGRYDQPPAAFTRLSQRARESMFGLVHMASYGTIKRISSAIGSPDLFRVYDVVNQASDAPAVELIHSSLSLDQSQGFPEDRVVESGGAYKRDDNFIAYSLLRSLIVNHFQLFGGNFDLKQRVCSALDIEYTRIQGATRARLLTIKGEK
jgi:hypothetical protein